MGRFLDLAEQFVEFARMNPTTFSIKERNNTVIANHLNNSSTAEGQILKNKKSDSFFQLFSVNFVENKNFAYFIYSWRLRAAAVKIYETIQINLNRKGLS